MAGLSDILYGAQIGRTITDPIMSVIREGRAAKRRREDIESARRYQEQRESAAERRQIEREDRALRQQLLLQSVMHPELGITAQPAGLEGESIAEPGAIEQTAPQLERLLNQRTVEEFGGAKEPLGESGGVPINNIATELQRRMKLAESLRGLTDATSDEIDQARTSNVPTDLPKADILDVKDRVANQMEIPRAKGTVSTPIGDTGFSMSPSLREKARKEAMKERLDLEEIESGREIAKAEKIEEARMRGKIKGGGPTGLGGSPVSGNKRLDVIRDFSDLSGIPSKQVIDELNSGNTTLDEMAAIIGQYKGSREIPAGEIKSVIAWESLDRKLQRLEDNLVGLEDEFGPIKGNWNEFILKYPLAKQDPRLAEVFAEVNSFAADQIHEKYGGALTPGEMARAQRWAISTNVPVETLKGRIKAAREGIADDKGAFKKTLDARRLRAPDLFKEDVASENPATPQKPPAKKGFKVLSSE